nr:aldehyde dehydrogenase family protein [Thermoleophilaceae bacterium]
MATTTTTRLQNFIDGDWADAGEGATEEVLNPATATPMANAQLSTKPDVDRAVAAAQRAYDGWAAATPGERALALLRLADAIEGHADELADLESQNAGKPRHAFLEDEVPAMVDQLRFF